MAEEKTKEVIELRVPTTVKSLIEALVFAAKEPLTVKQMKDIYVGDGPQAYLRQLDAEEVEASINELNSEYESAEKPYRIVRIAGGYQFATLSSYADWIGRLYKEQGRRKLSQSGIESLAIIAYKQPVTKADIESIRGVNCDYVLKTLLEKELVTIVGRAHAPGRPLLYGTTREFLKHFGLNEITDLPRPREIEEILGESQFETERRMLEAQAGAERMKEEEPEFKSRLPHIPKKKSELNSTVEIKAKDNQREIKTVERAETPTNAGAQVPAESETPQNLTQEVIHRQVEQPSPRPDIDLSLDLQSHQMVMETGSETKVPLEDLVAPMHDEDAQESVAENKIVEENTLRPAPLESQAVAVDAVARRDPPDMPAIQDPGLEEFRVERAGNEAQSQSSVNKSKWQSWKEKVQGFIRKIFG
jgi:segregation and condensation protein B